MEVSGPGTYDNGRFLMLSCQKARVPFNNQSLCYEISRPRWTTSRLSAEGGLAASRMQSRECLRISPRITCRAWLKTWGFSASDRPARSNSGVIVGMAPDGLVLVRFVPVIQSRHDGRDQAKLDFPRLE